MTDDYNAILACRDMGQMSERQWQEHLSDPLFALWYQRKMETVK